MDFMVRLPTIMGGYLSIWVAVDRFSKSIHFISIKVKYKIENLAHLYIRKIVRLHGMSIFIIFDQGSLFTSHFWKDLWHRLGTQLDNISPQTDGYSRGLSRCWRICFMYV